MKIAAALRATPALLLIGLALAGPWIAPHAVDTPVTAPYATPDSAALLGGDQLGRDVLARLLAGGRDLVLSPSSSPSSSPARPRCSARSEPYALSSDASWSAPPMS